MATGKEKLVKNLKYIFEPKSIAVVGASNIPNKLGNVLMKNLVGGQYEGRIYPVNPKYDEVLNVECAKSISGIRGAVDCAIIATPAETVSSVLEECGRKGVKGAIVLSAGFREVGNVEGEDKIRELALKYDMAVIGPNCLGILDVHQRVDNIFFPLYKLERPTAGGISFITQSGAVGTCVIDMIAKYGVGLAKFVSYGNAAVLNEADILEYLLTDKKTRQIVLYMEGAKEGARLLKIMKRVNKVKPIIVLKAGKYGGALKAAKSHTGNLAGNYLAYKAAFRQSKVIEAESLDELFDFVKIFNQPLPKGERMMIITNGGGLGVLTADAIEENRLVLAELSPAAREKFKQIIPSYTTAGNPLDLTADAGPEDYEKVVDIAMKEPEIDGLFIDVLFQTPKMDERILGVLEKASADRAKPIAVTAVGGTFTERYRKVLEENEVPTYGSPRAAVKAMKKLVDYSLKSKCKKCFASPK